MNQIQIVLTICLLFAVLNVVVVFQAVLLSHIFKSWAWMLLTAAFTISGARHVYVLLRVPAEMVVMTATGQSPVLHLEEWLTSGLTFAANCCLIIGFHTMRKDLKRLGI